MIIGEMAVVGDVLIHLGKDLNALLLDEGTLGRVMHQHNLLNYIVAVFLKIIYSFELTFKISLPVPLLDNMAESTVKALC